MFLTYFGLKEQPFGVTPDPRFLYLGDKHREALASLVYGTETERGFLALIARPGMGKTSLLVQYLDHYANQGRTCHLFQPDCNATELLRHVLRGLGIDHGKKDVQEMRDSLNQVLHEETAAGRRFVLVIDEAQNLADRVLESVRLLSNFETPTKKLMHIVLAGQPQLAERLAKPSMTQLRQRVSAVIRLNPFSIQETYAYIEHRLRVAGYQGAPLFTDSARALIAEHSEGIPRNINNLCFNAMSLAYATDAKQVDVKAVREVISDLEIESLVPGATPTAPSVRPIQVAVSPILPTVSKQPRYSPARSQSEEKQYGSERGAGWAATPLSGTTADDSVPKFYTGASSSIFPRRHAILLTILAAAVIAAALAPLWIRISLAWINVSAALAQTPVETEARSAGWGFEPSTRLRAKDDVKPIAGGWDVVKQSSLRAEVQSLAAPWLFPRIIGMEQAQVSRFVVELLRWCRMAKVSYGKIRLSLRGSQRGIAPEIPCPLRRHGFGRGGGSPGLSWECG